MSKLLDEVRDTLRVHHYAMKTEKPYAQWIKRFILLHKKKTPVRHGQAGSGRISDLADKESRDSLSILKTVLENIHCRKVNDLS